MVTSRQYDDVISNLSRIHCPFDTLKNLKEKYENSIASNRSLERCRDLQQLLKLLEKRDLINPNNMMILADIAEFLNSPDAMTNSFGAPQLRSVLPRYPTNLYDKIKYIIGRDIGYKWKEFARGLNFKEGEIDMLEESRRSVQDRILEILDVYRENCPQHLLRTNILNALCDARRADLSKEINTIFDNSNIRYNIDTSNQF